MVVVFGRPGAGKTSIAETAMQLTQQKYKHDTYTQDDIFLINNNCILLDLDVCIPNWMKENFAQGIYPTLEERLEFAKIACNYIHQQMIISNNDGRMIDDEQKQKQPLRKHLNVIISFSFVNVDLREYFSSQFPYAKWALVDVNYKTAQERIDQREGHFYKGAPPKSSSSIETSTVAAAQGDHQKQEENDNSQWDFAPVDFDHVILDGLLPIEHNANRVVEILLNC